MPLSVKRITLWRADVENQSGVLSRILEPLAAAGADLQVVMGYRFPTTPERSAVELYPVSGRRTTAAAGEGGAPPPGNPPSPGGGGQPRRRGGAEGGGAGGAGGHH